MQDLETLESTIRDYIKSLYNAEYTGWLHVTYEDGMFTLELGIPSYMMKTYITMATDSEDDFLTFIKEELRTRNYMKVYFYKVVRKEESRDE